MDKQRIGSILRRFLPPVLALLLVAAFLLYCDVRVQTEFPELYPQNGILDVREVDFSTDVYHLVNHWDYYPGQLLSPELFSDPASAPEKDNDAPLNITKGTWRLLIQAKPNTWLSLCSYSIDYSTRIFVNDREVRSIGLVSDDTAQAISKVRYVTLPLYFDDSGETEIICQYATYAHNDGGFIQKSNTLIFRNDCDSQRYGNSEMLLQMLINLIVNASRHTEEGRITVNAKNHGNQVKISVSDSTVYLAGTYGVMGRARANILPPPYCCSFGF